MATVLGRPVNRFGLTSDPNQLPDHLKPFAHLLRDDQGHPATAWIQSSDHWYRPESYFEPQHEHLRPYISDKVFLERLSHLNRCLKNSTPLWLLLLFSLWLLITMGIVFSAKFYASDRSRSHPEWVDHPPPAMWVFFSSGIVFLGLLIRYSNRGSQQLNAALDRFNQEDHGKLHWGVFRVIHLKKTPRGIPMVRYIVKLVPEISLPEIQATGTTLLQSSVIQRETNDLALEEGHSDIVSAQSVVRYRTEWKPPISSHL